MDTTRFEELVSWLRAFAAGRPDTAEAEHPMGWVFNLSGEPPIRIVLNRQTERCYAYAALVDLGALSDDLGRRVMEHCFRLNLFPRLTGGGVLGYNERDNCISAHLFLSIDGLSRERLFAALEAFCSRLEVLWSVFDVVEQENARYLRASGPAKVGRKRRPGLVGGQA